MTNLDLFRLDGQAAVVVGGAGGLGAAMAVEWAPHNVPATRSERCAACRSGAWEPRTS